MSEFEEKVNNFLRRVKELIKFFVRCRVHDYWPNECHKIADALEELDSDLAISLESEIPKGGMGGLLDMYIFKENGHETENHDKDNKQLQLLIAEVSSVFQDLRQYTQHEHETKNT